MKNSNSVAITAKEVKPASGTKAQVVIEVEKKKATAPTKRPLGVMIK